MAISVSTGLKDALLNGQFNAGSGAGAFDSGTLAIYSGSAPANANAAVTGTVLATITLPADAFAASSSGSVAKSGTWSDSSADATGTASHYRLVASGDDGTLSTTQKRIQGTVGQGSGDLSLDNTSIASGQTVTISTFTISL